MGGGKGVRGGRGWDKVACRRREGVGGERESDGLTSLSVHYLLCFHKTYNTILILPVSAETRLESLFP